MNNNYSIYKIIRFGKRKSAFPITPTVLKPRLQQYIDQQRLFNNIYNHEDDESYKILTPGVIRNSKDLYDMLFSPRRNNGNYDHHQYYLMQQDTNNPDINVDSN